MIQEIGQGNADEQSENIGNEIYPFSVAIDSGLDEFNQSAINQKTEDEKSPMLWFAQGSRQDNRCVGNQMIGFIGARSIWKSAEGVQRESRD